MKKMGLYQVYFELPEGFSTRKESFSSIHPIPTTLEEVNDMVNHWKEDVQQEYPGKVPVFISNFILVNTLEDSNE